MFKDEDLGVFFDTDDFAVTVHQMDDDGDPIEPGFAAILSEVDEEALQGYVVGTVRELRYPTAAATLLLDMRVREGANTWRVIRDGRQQNDGAESVTYLVKG